MSKARSPRPPGSNATPGPTAQLLPAQRQSLEDLERRLGADVEVRIRPGARTPRQIKGRILQPAIYEAMGSGKQKGELTARTFLRQNRGLLRIQDPDRELRLRNNQVDESGGRHLRFTQHYKGVPVWPADINIHLDAPGNVNLMDGAYVATPGPKMVTTPIVEVAAAIATARKQFDGGEAAEVTEQGLIFYAPGDRPTRLAWKVELSYPPRALWLVVVDAVSGRVLTAYNRIMEVNRAGAGIGPLGNRRELNVWEEGGKYFLVDTSKRMYDPSSDPPGEVRGGVTVLDLRNQKGTPDSTIYLITSDAADSGWLEDGVSVSFGLSKTYDYYLEKHSRNSLDGEGGSMTGIVRTDVGGINAFWNGKAMIFGNTCKIAGAMDVVGHELTHGVTEKTANLVYQDQPGALNEAFSDIFGEAIEAYIKGDNDWLMAADLVFEGCLDEPMRNVKDPNSINIAPGLPYPAKMSQFIRTDQDNGGVHLNSLIVTHAFYLLAEGLDGAIGMADAERIFYRALSLHLVRNSAFVDARLACIKAAQDIFGEGSPQARKTADAFDAVEIFGTEATPEPTPGPAPTGNDATLFVYASNGNYFLGRREPALGDDTGGVALSAFSISPTRPAVSGDGSLAVFVDSVYDVCMIATNGAAAEECIGQPGSVHSVAMSADGNRFAIVFRGNDGNAENKISVFDLATDKVDTYTLKSPAIDGLSDIEVLRADAMDFSLDGELLVYDALNKFKVEGGGSVGGWSIYAIDLDSGDTLTIVPPVAGMDIGYPAMGSVNEQLVVFEAVDQWTSQSTTYVANLQTGDYGPVARTQGVFSTPSFTGDDTAIVYSVADAFAIIGTSLYRQALGLDHISPSGSPESWISDRAFGVIYRRGAFTSPPRADLAAAIEEQTDPVTSGAEVRYRVRVSNHGPDQATGVKLSITLVGPGGFSARPAGCTQQGDGLQCNLGDIPPGGEKLLLVGVATTATGTLVHGANAVSAVIDPQTDDNTAVAKTRVMESGGAPAATMVYQAKDAPLRSTAKGNQVALTTLNSAGHPLVLLDGDGHSTWSAHELPGDAASIQGSDIWFDPKDGALNVAVPSANGLLLHSRDTDGYWRTRNLTELVGGAATAITASLTHFITADGASGYDIAEKDRNNVHIIGTNSDGDLIDYFQLGADGGGPVSWAYKNITREDLIPNNQPIPAWVSNLVGYSTPWNGWSIAGLNGRGEIIAVWTAPDRRGVWAATNLSAQYGTPPLDPSAGLTVYVNWGMNLAGVLPNGHLGITWWSRQYEDEQKAKGSDKVWAFSDITNQAGGPLLKPAAVAACTVRVDGRPDQESVHVAGLKQNGDLVDYWWTPPAGVRHGDWAVDRIGGATSPLRGLSASCGSDLRVSIGGIGAGGEILRYLWMADRSWRFQDVSRTVAQP